MTLIIGLLLVAGLIFSASIGVRGSNEANLDRVFDEERPSSFSFHVGDPKASTAGFFQSLKASLKVFGLIPRKQDDETALKALVEETKKEIAAEAKKKAAEEKEAKNKRKRTRRHFREALTEIAQPSPTGSSDQNRKMNDEAMFLGGSGGGDGAIPQAPDYDSYMDESLPQDAEGWRARIVAQRSYRVLTQFVALYKAGTIPDTVFYAVVRELLIDQDTLLVKYGVLALSGAVETESFATLVEYRPQLPHDPEIYQLVNQTFQSYAEPAHLPYLFTFLSNPEGSDIFFEAVVIAERSIRNWYLVEEEAAAEGEEKAMDTVHLIYGQLSRVLVEGHRRAASEELKVQLANLMSLMGSTPDEMVAGVEVPY